MKAIVQESYGIERTYPLSKVPDALRHVGEGHARGKVVITAEEG